MEKTVVLDGYNARETKDILSIQKKKTRLSDDVLYVLIYLSASVSVILLIGIIGYVFIKGIREVNWTFLSSVTSALKGTTGIAGNILNTIYIILLTLFGLFGLMFFGNTLGLGYSLLTGALTLAIMVLPLITRNTQEALKRVPDSYRNGALGMGATKWYMIRTILLPSAMPGIVTGIILAIGRIVGESAALLFTAGSGYLLPKTGMGYLHKILESGGTLTIQLYLSMSKGQYNIAFGIAVVLLAIVLVINMITKVLAGKLDVTRKN